MGNCAGLFFGQTEGVLAFVAAFAVESETSADDASAGFVGERFIAGDAVVFGVVVAAWSFFDAFLLLDAVEVGVHAFDAGSVLVHFLAEFVLGDAFSIRSEDKVRVALKTFAVFGDQTVGQFASVVQQSVLTGTFRASAHKVLQATIDFARFG